MKALLFLAVSALFADCAPSDYIIKGKAGRHFEGRTVYLQTLDGSTLDSCVVKDGMFTIDGQVGKQTVCNLRSGFMKTPVVVENGADIKIDFTSMPVMASDQGGLNDALYSILKKVTDARLALREKEDRMRDANASPQAIDEATRADYAAVYDLYRDGISENKDNLIGAYLLGMTARTLYPTLEKLDSMMNVVKYAKDLELVTNIHSSMKALEATKVGQNVIDFPGKTIDGKDSKFSDYVGKGKYVLVDFWASWCGPCKAEIPNLMELHKKHKDGKLIVLGINVFDQEKKFKAALASEGIEYPQIFIPGTNKDDAAKLYGVTGIPQIMLFAPDGTVVKRDLRGKEMIRFVEEQLKK